MLPDCWVVLRKREFLQSLDSTAATESMNANKVSEMLKVFENVFNYMLMNIKQI